MKFLAQQIMNNIIRNLRNSIMDLRGRIQELNNLLPHLLSVPEEQRDNVLISMIELEIIVSENDIKLLQDMIKEHMYNFQNLMY